MITQYLVTGQEEIIENELILNKILCGFPVESDINFQFSISHQEKLECQEMLNAVISHLKVLKNTSINGLREAFLKRSGKLSIGDTNTLN